MVAINKNKAISTTLKWEGGYTDHPKDPGGPTNFGITIADAKKYWKKDATADDMQLMTKDVAINIYTTKYWKTSYYDCDKLDGGVDLAVFDFGVNSGPATAKKYLDQSVGGTAEETVNKLCDKRMEFLKKLKIWPTFGKGWTNRVADIRKEAVKLTKNSPIINGTIASTGAAVGGGMVIASAYPESWWPLVVFCSVAAVLLISMIVYNYNKD